MRRATRALAMLAGLGVVMLSLGAVSASAYNPITRSKSNQTVTLDGKHMTIQQVVDVARYGAKVKLTDGARQRSLDAYELLLQGATENMPIYFFNRGAGASRNVVIFEGDPLRPDNKAFLLARQLARFRGGPTQGMGPEVADEEIVRAMMVVRANTMVYEAASPDLTQALLDLLNKYVTPVVQSRGSPGEGDLPQMGNVGGTMVGAGDAYYKGKRMSAAEALDKAGITPLVPFAADDAALVSTNAYSAGQAALLVYDTQLVLDWADLNYAIDLQAMNSSVTPISTPVQDMRPFPWVNKTAARVMRMIAGSYLFGADPDRIIQDPESLRATSQRNAGAWEAWDRLKHNVLIQVNSSDHNPAVTPGVSPEDSPELSTPWFMQYYVRGGYHNQNQDGYIMSNANWDPIPFVNDIEYLTIAMANQDVTIAQRIQRFSNTFFTVITPGSVIPAAELALAPARGSEYSLADIMGEIHILANPVPAEGNAIVSNVEDIEAASRIKVARARLMTDNSLQLIALSLQNNTFWMDVRRAQDPARSFGSAPTAAWQAYRTVVPWQMPTADRPAIPGPTLAYNFAAANPASNFIRDGGETMARFRARAGASIRAAKVRTLRFAKTAKAKRAYLAAQARR